MLLPEEDNVRRKCRGYAPSAQRLHDQPQAARAPTFNQTKPLLADWRLHRGVSQLFFEVVGIDLRHSDRPRSHTHFMLNHEVGQLVPIDQNDAVDRARIGDRLLAE